MKPSETAVRGGPLAGIRVVELAGIGPGPLAAMFLADMGATVIRVDRQEPSGLGIARPPRFDLGLRNRKSIRVDLKDPAAVETVMQLIDQADALIEGFRPGVTERLGLGPKNCLARNPRLVYGRITGWGQYGPLAQSAGHDINYIAITGVLDAIGRAGGPPTVPLNVVGDFAGGSLYLAMGMLAALLEARGSGKGQVVDAAIVDGVAMLLTPWIGLRAAGMVNDERGTNLLDSGAPFYDTYACADGKYVAIGPIESKFYDQLLQRLGLDSPELRAQMDRGCWPEARRQFAETFKTRTRDAWAEIFRGTDLCVSPVLSIGEAFDDPHLKARRTFIQVDGVTQPAPGPRFSRTSLPDPEPPAGLGPDVARAALEGWLPAPSIEQLITAGTVR